MKRHFLTWIQNRFQYERLPNTTLKQYFARSKKNFKKNTHTKRAIY